MITEGQVILFRFPQTDQTEAKLRPALVLNQLPGPYNDWLICMISSQLHQAIPDFDEVLTSRDSDFNFDGIAGLQSIINNMIPSIGMI
jgi:mRNA interferase MazF